MSTILVVDDSAICREPIVAALKQEGFEVASASNGKDALSSLRVATPDLLLLDLGLPDLDGWSVLRGLRDLPNGKSVPVILLTSVCDAHCVVRAGTLGVREYMLKDRFSFAEMLLRIRKQLQPANGAGQPGSSASTKGAPIKARNSGATPAKLTREGTLERLEQAKGAKALAGVVMKVIELASSPRGGATELANVLKQDPVLSARVLQVANSAGFATQKPQVSTVDEAVRNIGASAIRNMAASVGLFEIVSGSGPGMDEIGLMRCWQHCFAVAAIMDWVMPKMDDASAGFPHLVGLCHDLWEIVLRQMFAEEYSGALTQVETTGQPLREVIVATFGMQLEAIIAQVLSNLGLPTAIRAPILEYFKAADSGKNLPPIVRALGLADNYANGLLLAATPAATVRPLEKAEFNATAGASKGAIDGPAIRGAVVSTTCLLAGHSASARAALLQPLLPTRNVKVWYFRHSEMAEFDPLEGAMRDLAQAETFDHLPGDPDELDGFKGIVIAAPRRGIEAFSFSELDRVIKLAAGRKIPILCLAAAAKNAPAPVAGIELGTYPISLDRLREFVARL